MTLRVIFVLRDFVLYKIVSVLKDKSETIFERNICLEGKVIYSENDFVSNICL